MNEGNLQHNPELLAVSTQRKITTSRAPKRRQVMPCALYGGPCGAGPLGFTLTESVPTSNAARSTTQPVEGLLAFFLPANTPLDNCPITDKHEAVRLGAERSNTAPPKSHRNETKPTPPSEPTTGNPVTPTSTNTPASKSNGSTRSVSPPPKSNTGSAC